MNEPKPCAKPLTGKAAFQAAASQANVEGRTPVQQLYQNRGMSILVITKIEACLFW